LRSDSLILNEDDDDDDDDDDELVFGSIVTDPVSHDYYLQHAATTALSKIVFFSISCAQYM